MKRISRRRQAPHRIIDELPFVKPVSKRKHPKGFDRNCWSVPRCGDYDADCAIGMAYACNFLYWLRLHPDERTDMLCSIVSDMVRGGEVGGVEIGFLETIHRMLLVGAGVPYRG